MRILLCVLSLFVMLSCDRRVESNESATISKTAPVEQVSMNEAPADKPASPADRPVLERKLIRNGSMSFEVEDVTTTRTKIDELTRLAGGYVSSEMQNGNEEHPRYHQVIRIPGASVDDFVAKVEALAMKVESKQITVQDVTGEYVDIGSRLSAKQKIEARFLEIVKQAKTIEDILRVEEQIGSVQSEIESMQGRLKFLSNQASYGTLELTYHKHYSVVPPKLPGVGSKFASSFIGGWNGLVTFLIGLTATWPFLLIIGTFALLYWRRIKGREKQVSPQ
jgi:hypothetical protein